MKKLDEVNKDPRFQSYMSAEEDDRKLLNSFRRKGLNEGIKIGIEQGIEKGIEQNRKMVAENLVKNGISNELILKILNISSDELQKYLSN